MKILVFGGSGTFGSLVCQGLKDRGLDVVSVSRHGPEKGDITSQESCRALLEKFHPRVVVNCVGPFSLAHLALTEACVVYKCHYVDMTEDRELLAKLLSLDDKWKEAGIKVVTGCSSLPGISGALAKAAGLSKTKVRVSLFVGNKNTKGEGALTSALAQVGKKIRANGKTLIGFADREVVEFPEPYGRRHVVNFESPDYDIFPKRFGIDDIVVKVGFELPMSTLLIPLFSKFGAHRLCRMVTPLKYFGHSGGAVLVETPTMQTGLCVADDGQLMAALPAIWAAEKLARHPHAPGAYLPFDLEGGDLLNFLAASGYKRFMIQRSTV